MRQIWTATERRLLIAHYAERGATALAEELGRTADSVSSQARRHGLSSRDYRRRTGLARASLSPTVNPRFFEGEPTPATAFVLGYIWGCGSIKHKFRKVIRITCPHGDIKPLKRIRDLMRSRHLIQTSEHQHVLEICNSYLTESLIQHFGVPPGRAHDGQPPCLPDTLLASFAAGHLSATGSRSPQSVRWFGHASVIAWIAAGISTQVNVPPPKYLNDRVRKSIVWVDPTSVRAISEWLDSED